jgi:predicted TIM-barrel fold metal-dependent hydrolase
MSQPDSILATAAQGISLRDTALVIDAHAHLGPTMMVHTHASSAAQILESMDRIGIRTACLSSLTALSADVCRGNDEVAEAVRGYPGRFAGYAVINPNDTERVESELERCLQKGSGHWAVKIHPAFHAYPSDGPVYQRVYTWLQRRGGVVLSHVFENPAILEKLSAHYPDVVFVMAHAGGYDGRLPYPFAQLIRERANVYADITLSVVPFSGLERLVEECGPEKLLFATDTPFQDNAHQIGRVTHARLSDEIKRQILGENMRRLLERYAPELEVPIGEL